MNKIKKYTGMQKMFETEKELIKQINSPKILVQKLNEFKEEALNYFKEKNTDAFQYTNRLYQVVYDRATKLNINLKDYPTTLEEIMN